jgi:hypothetical protein
MACHCCCSCCFRAAIQAPEQASNAAGRLDFCLDSWGLGLLLLCLRRGKRPFWWLQVRTVSHNVVMPSCHLVLLCQLLESMLAGASGPSGGCRCALCGTMLAGVIV